MEIYKISEKAHSQLKIQSNFIKLSEILTIVTEPKKCLYRFKNINIQDV